MFNPIDILDKELYFKTPIFNKMLQQYLETYGKDAIFYVNPNEGLNSTDDNSKDIVNNEESSKRTDNYTLAYGKDLVGYDYSKLDKVNAKVLIDYNEFYTHDIGAIDQTTFYIHVLNTPISRGDIVSFKIQDKEVFYRITEKAQSYMEIVYRITCRLIEVKKLKGSIRPYDIHQHKPDYSIMPDYGIVL